MEFAVGDKVVQRTSDSPKNWRTYEVLSIGEKFTEMRNIESGRVIRELPCFLDHYVVKEPSQEEKV